MRHIHLFQSCSQRSCIDLRGEVYEHLADRLKHLLAPHSDEPRSLAGERLLVSLMRGNWTYFPSLAWRRETLDPIGFRQDLDVALNLVALASLVLDGATMLLLPNVVFSIEGTSVAPRRKQPQAQGASSRSGE